MENWKWVLKEDHEDFQEFAVPESRPVPIEMAHELWLVMSEMQLKESIDDDDYHQLFYAEKYKRSGWGHVYLEPIALGRLLVRLAKATNNFDDLKGNPERYSKIVQLNQAVIAYFKSLG